MYINKAPVLVDEYIMPNLFSCTPNIALYVPHVLKISRAGALRR